MVKIELELNLLEGEKLGAAVAVVANTLLIISTLIATRIVLSKNKGVNESIRPSSSEVTLMAAGLFLISGTIALIIASVRFEQRKEELQKPDAKGSLVPNILILISTVLSLTSYIILSVGTKIRVDEEGEITII